MLAAINIAECNIPMEKEDSEVIALVHIHAQKSVSNMLLMIDGNKVYLVDGCNDMEGGRK